MLELRNDGLNFSFTQVHPSAKLTIDLQRTLRIPDDGRTYPLPPGKGRFPLRMIDQYAAKLPPSWTEKGGVLLPMYQSEAMWINFTPFIDPNTRAPYPFAVKISTGKVSAITGEPWQSGLRNKDYCVPPKQPWIDGYVVENGKIKQFVAAPLGSGVSVEQQVTGKDEFGGVQIEVFPMKADWYNQRFPVRPPVDRHSYLTKGGYYSAGITTKGMMSSSVPPAPGARRGGPFTMHNSVLRGAESPTPIGEVSEAYYSCDSLRTNDDPVAVAGVASNSSSEFYSPLLSVQSMSMAAGGLMSQQIFEDPYGIEAWDLNNSSRCFIHLANSMTWRLITGENPPTVPMTASEYAACNLPWFDYYQESQSITASEKLKNIKSVKDLKPELLPENQTPAISPSTVHVIQGSPHAVKQGNW